VVSKIPGPGIPGYPAQVFQDTRLRYSRIPGSGIPAYPGGVYPRNCNH
jgi:hypothetical protein